MSSTLAELDRRRAAARLGGGEPRIAAQHAKGKLTARERLDVLLDPGSFEELDMFVEHNATDFGMAEQVIPATAWSRVRGRSTAAGLCFQPGFHRVRRLAVRASRAEDCKLMDTALKVGAPVIGSTTAAARASRKASPALGGYAEVFQRNVLGVRRGAALLSDHGAVRGRGGSIRRR
jgi:propionyl-CoA carboxylase beta chain